MRNDSCDNSSQEAARQAPPGSEARPAQRAGATVSIPPRPGPTTPFGPTTLRARLALLRPQPVRLRPAAATDK